MSEPFATAIAEYEPDRGIRPGTPCADDAEFTVLADLCDAAIRAATGRRWLSSPGADRHSGLCQAPVQRLGAGIQSFIGATNRWSKPGPLAVQRGA